MSKELISQEVVESFLNGEDPELYIVGVEYDYRTNTIYKIIQDPEKGKIIKQDTIVPFLWVGDLTGLNFYQDNKTLQKKKMAEHGILIETLQTYDNPRLNNGLRYLVKSLKGYTDLLNFFKQGGIDPWGEKYKQYFQILNPSEQYLVQKRKRLFKGIDDYSDVFRFVFDIETTGLNPETDRIIMIGVKTNRGLQKSIDAFGENGEKRCITEFFNIIRELKPTIIGGYNSASFDFPFIMKRVEILKMDTVKLTQILSLNGIKVKEGILKLANEIEPYNQYVIWGFNIIDISHSVRRAQAINSEIKRWNLKYVTKYLEKEKPNRIYVDGAYISKIYLGGESYYVNPKSGGWRKIGDPGTDNLLQKYPDKYEIWPGRKLIEQYLDDDLYETMVVDDSFSQATFLLSKLVPTTYERIATMGTATLWKLIMLAWSYQNNLAIPEKDEKRDFVGGLSRLLRVGYSKGIVKFDFASLYPSIDLVYDIFPDCDVMGALKAELKYFRNIRIGYKRLKEEYEKTDLALSEKYDRKQLPIKIFINAYFGSLSAPKVFHWGDMNLGEMTTCIGRQCLRMMIMFYTQKGYQPLTMDSVEYDTPIYLKDNNENLIILPICDLFDENSLLKSPDNLRDFSPKEFTILTKNGWKNINYVYKHKTDKSIHKIITKDRMVCCTSDHSIFQNEIQIKPTEINRGDKIDIINIPILKSEETMTIKRAKLIGFFIGDGSCSYRKRNQKCITKKKGESFYKVLSGNFDLNNSRKELLEEFKNILLSEYGVKSQINDYLRHSSVYKLQSSNAELCKWFAKNCYTSYRQKMIPKEILNGTKEIMMSFMEGFYLADGWGDNFSEPTDITQKSKVCVAGLSHILKVLNISYRISTRKDKINMQSLIMGSRINGIYHKIDDNKSEKRSDKIWNNIVLENNEQYVYDISTEDGTFVGGIGGILLKNTDGVCFSTPSDIDGHSYVGKGNNELVEKGQEYAGIYADTAEFNDIFMRNEMGLDIDYTAESMINVSKKNYILKMIKKGKVKIKVTGNTLKSKKLPQYIVEFLDEGFKYLLDGDGTSFINLYYDYIDKLYNHQIPLVKLANKARVKMSIEEYKKYTKKKNKAGAFMARQAYMELILQEDYLASLGETIYYVNNGKKKSDGDVQKVSKYTQKYTRKQLVEYQDAHEGKLPPKESHIEVNCYRISENDILNNPEMTGEYNIARYIATFNKRILPMLVVFKPEIRDDILIEDPKDRQYFTALQCELDNGHPLKPEGQGTIEEVMTLSDKEVTFWNRVEKDPYFMYVDGTLPLVDQYWVEQNKKVVKLEAESTKKIEDDEIISNDGRDLAYHAIEV